MAGMRRKRSAKDKKQAVADVSRIRREHCDVRTACASVGITPKQYYEWKRSLEAGGLSALTQKSRRPKTFGNQVNESLRQRVISEGRSGRYKSANQIKQALAADGVEISVPTIIKILESAELYGFLEIRERDGKLVKKWRGVLESKH